LIFSKLFSPFFFTIFVLSTFLIKGANDNFVILLLNLSLIIFFLAFNKIYIINLNKVISIFLLFLFIQFMPIPSFVLNFFSPNSFELYNSLYNNDIFFISVSVQNSLIYFFIFFSSMLIMAIISSLIKNKKDLNRVFKIIIYFAVFQSIFGILIFIFEINKILFFYEKIHYFESVTGTFINRNNFSFYLVLSFIVSIYYLNFYQKYFFHKKKLDIFNFFLSELFLIRLSILIIAIAILLTKSRAGNITFFSILTIIFLIDFYRNRKISFFNLTLFSIIFIDLLILSNILGSEKTIERLALTSFEGERTRIEVFKLGLKEFYNFPFLGYGMGGFEVLYDLKYNTLNAFYHHVHNDFIEYLGELGVFGFILLFICFPISIFLQIRILNIPSELKLISVLVFIAILIHGNLDFALHLPANIYYLFLILGICMPKSFKKNIT